MFKRSTRIRELLLQQVTRGIAEVKDPGLSGFLTITDLELAKDGKSAKVFYSLLGTPEDRKKTQRALDRSSEFLRRLLRSKLSLRIIPKLSFVFDETPSRANRIERLIDDLSGREPSSKPAPELQEKMLDSLASRESKRRRKRGR